MNNTVELLGYYGSDEVIACSAWTSTSRDFEIFEYVMRDESKNSEDPGKSVKYFAIKPPVHDSAVDRIKFFFLARIFISFSFSEILIMYIL